MSSQALSAAMRDAFAASQIQSLADPTVSGGALTLSWNPAPLQFRVASQSSGAVISMAAPSAALPITIPSGATLGGVSGVQMMIAHLIAYNGGSPVSCVANIAGGVDLSESGTISPTTISASATSNSVIYSASAVAANSPYRVVGMYLVTEATAGTWATLPVLTQGIGGQAFAALMSIGFGQTRQNVTASRAAGTTYYNATSRPIYVSICINSAYGGSPTLTAGGIVCANWTSNLSQTTYVNYFEIILPGESYIFASSGVASIVTWIEIR
jgi:hypothetical protein